MKPIFSPEKQMSGRFAGWIRAAMTRRSFLKQLGAAGFAALPLLAGRSVSGSGSDGSEVPSSALKSAARRPLRPAIPPIDAAAPAHTRTATFAMG